MTETTQLLNRITPEWCKSIFRFACRKIPFSWRLGRRYRELVRLYNESQWWPLERLKDLQDQKLRSLIRHAYEKVPYYREVMNERGLKPEDIRTADDLPKLPFLTKTLVKEHFEALKAEDFHRWKPIQAHSGGTSGDYLVFHLGREAYLAERAVYVRRYAWAGYEEGDRCVFMRGPLKMKWPDGSDRLSYFDLHRKWLQLETMGLQKDRLKRIVEIILEYRPKVISAYPSNAEIIARHLLAGGLRAPSVKAIITSAETIYPWHRTLVRKAFGCEIFDYYGQAEHTANAAQCPKGAYHHNMEIAAVEVVDTEGRTITEGRGEIVGTCLDNHAQPLIRYRMGDFVTLSGARCACGRALPVWDNLEGRYWETLVRPDGSPLSGSTLGGHLIPVLDKGELGQLQIKQMERDRIALQVARDEKFSEATLQELIRILQAELGPEMRIETRFVDAIPKSPTGKHQLLVRECPLDDFPMVHPGTEPSPR